MEVYFLQHAWFRLVEETECEREK